MIIHGGGEKGKESGLRRRAQKALHIVGFSAWINGDLLGNLTLAAYEL